MLCERVHVRNTRLVIRGNEIMQVLFVNLRYFNRSSSDNNSPA